MKKVPLSMISDVLFYGAAVGFFVLGLLRYFRTPLALCIVLAVAFAFATGCFVALFLYGRNRKKWLSKRQREEREALMLHLTLEKEERVRDALLAALTADGKTAHCEGEGLRVDDTLYLPVFTMQPVSADEVARLLRLHGTQPFALVCNAVTPEAQKLLASFGRKAVCGDEVYDLFTRTQTTPSPLICAEIPRKTVRQRLVRSFSKTNARPFFVSGLLLLVMSLFTIFPTYYVVTGSILLVSSVLVRAFGYA